MPDLFISYKREDRRHARRIAEALVQCELHVWWDVELLPGDRFPEEIHRVIEASRGVLVLWSRKSVASRWVREEAEHAANASKLFPARLDDVSLPFGFATLQTVDLSAWAAGRDTAKVPPWFLDGVVEFLENRPASAGAPAEAAAPTLEEYSDEAGAWRRAVHRGRTGEYLRFYGERGLFAPLSDAITDNRYSLTRRLYAAGQHIADFGTRHRKALQRLALALVILGTVLLAEAFIGFLPPDTGF